MSENIIDSNIATDKEVALELSRDAVNLIRLGIDIKTTKALTSQRDTTHYFTQNYDIMYLIYPKNTKYHYKLRQVL